MDVFEIHTHSFILRIWVEESDLESKKILWRGHITHVQSKERRYIEDLFEVVTFIESYLQPLGVKQNRAIHLGNRLQRWSKHIRQKLGI